MKLREEEFYEQYHQHGGTTIIPTEIFNELYDDATEEIERLNNDIKVLLKENESKEKVIKAQDNIINKAIEYIETHQLNFKKGTTTFGSERLSMEERKLIDILRGVDKDVSVKRV